MHRPVSFVVVSGVLFFKYGIYYIVIVKKESLCDRHIFYDVLWLPNHRVFCPQLATTSISKSEKDIVARVIVKGIHHAAAVAAKREAKEILPTKLTYILLCKYSHFSFRSSLACFLFVSSCYNMGNLFVFLLLLYYYYVWH